MPLQELSPALPGSHEWSDAALARLTYDASDDISSSSTKGSAKCRNALR
ncbi:hypothetical protein [Paraburkholderia sp. PGU19]|nr:hypothetical protein [Paraburkholderia sp. PGU19]